VELVPTSVGGLHDLTSILLCCSLVVVGHELHLTDRGQFMRYLVTAYYSEWVEATSEDDAMDTIARRLARIDKAPNADDFTYEVHDSEEAAQ